MVGSSKISLTQIGGERSLERINEKLEFWRRIYGGIFSYCSRILNSEIPWELGILGIQVFSGS